MIYNNPRLGTTQRDPTPAIIANTQAVVCVPSLMSPGGGSVLAPSARGDLY